MSEALTYSSTLVTITTNDNKDSKVLAIAAAQAADDRKGGDIVLLNVEDVSYLADYFVMVTGFSRAQVRAISQAVQEKAEQLCDRVPKRIEGQSDATWVLLDYGDVIIHIFQPKEREFYNLEAFWGHAEKVEFLPAS